MILRRKLIIPNGYRVKATSPWHLVQHLNGLKAACAEIKRREVPRIAAQACAYSIDMATLGRNQASAQDPLLTQLFQYLSIESQRAKNGQAGSTTDWGFSVVAIPLRPKTLRRQEWLCLTFTQREEFLKLWVADDAVEELSYDYTLHAPPDGVSVEDYAARVELWSEALADPVPQNNGFKLVVVDENLLDIFESSRDEALAVILAAMPGKDERAVIASNSVALKAKQKELMDKPSGLVDVSGNPLADQLDPKGEGRRSRAQQSVRDAIEWLGRKPPEVDELRLRYLSKLEPITEDSLLSKTLLLN